tara:strand:- start:160 stop:495 length:336 start_codon:yes stop_codon:yes gene_type:complete
MRYRIFFVSFLIAIIGLGCGVSNAKEANIALPTIMCGMCETNITNAFSDVEGLIKVSIDLEKKSGKVVYDADKISLAQIEEKIAYAGYKANNTLADKSAYDKLPRCCKVDG